MSSAGKYAHLQQRLEEIAQRSDLTAEFSFRDIEQLVGQLPASARTQRSWGANSGHSQALAWRNAGWHVDTVSFDRERVRFARGAVGGTYADRGRVPARHPRPSVTTGPVQRPTQTEKINDRVLLVGCVKTKADVPMPASELYTSTLFRRRREYADRIGAPWFIISSQWGLVHPDQIIAPYDMYLGAQPQTYRRAWGQFVVEQLALAMPLTETTTVEIHAGQDYIDAIAGPLRERNVDISTPVQVSSQGEMLQWYAQRLTTSPVQALLADALHHLSSLDRAMPNPEVAALSRSLARPGLYSWWVDAAGAADLSRGLGHPVAPCLIYAGQAGATREPSGKTSGATLAIRLLRQHFDGSTSGSTFRLTIAATLRSTFGTPPSKDDLSRWMAQHLRVATWPTDDADTLGRIEREMLTLLNPPLNLDEVVATPLRTRLTELRRALNRTDHDLISPE